MKLAFLCTVLLSLTRIAFPQNIQIQVLPQPVIYQENDLVIQCSITNPSQLSSVYYIQLHHNSSTGWETAVAIFKDQNPQIQWPSGSTLQNRASAVGSEINTPSTAKLKLTIDKDSVACPTDFTAYRCKFSGFSTVTSDAVTQETNPVTVTYTVKPRIIEMPRVRILGEFSDTPARQFPVATALQLTCQGQVGNDASKTIRWCSRKSTEFAFTGLPQTPIHSEASPSGCQYTRSSTITYNLTSTDIFTQFLCESGDTGMCGTGSAIQYVNITIAFPQNIQIQVLPQPVIYWENDLVIQCSITNPLQLTSLFYMQLLKNSSLGFETAVSIFKDLTPQIQWPSGSLQNRASAVGSEINTLSTARLKLTIDKNSVLCPTDFTAYRCKFSGFSTATSNAVTQETNPVAVTYTVKPRVIEMPRVRILGEFSDTPTRQFPVATVLQLTCEGQVGNDASKTIRWCARKSTDFTFTGLPQTPIHSEASLIGCQYTRSSTITYNLTSTDTFTQFLCESGDNGMCGTGSAIQYVNITIESSNEGNPTTNTRTADETSDAGIIAGGVIGGLAALILIILLVYFLVLRRKTDGETSAPDSPSDRTKEEVPGYNGPANPEGPVYSVPVKDHPPERQPRRKHPRDEEDRRKHGRHDGHENQGLDDDHTSRTEKEEVDYQNHGYSNRMMNDYGDDGDVMPQGFGSAV
ncbi:uncharacterized protein LOC111125833 isoform X3 [Crassostrea virginica]